MFYNITISLVYTSQTQSKEKGLVACTGAICFSHTKKYCLIRLHNIIIIIIIDFKMVGINHLNILPDPVFELYFALDIATWFILRSFDKIFLYLSIMMMPQRKQNMLYFAIKIAKSILWNAQMDSLGMRFHELKVWQV